MNNEAKFVASTDQGRVVVKRAEGEFGITMSPSEVEKATHIVGLALGMVEWDYVPPDITNTPFVVRFFDKQKFALERVDMKGSLPFRTVEGDELILMLNRALGICLNEQTHGKVVLKGQAAAPLLASEESF